MSDYKNMLKLFKDGQVEVTRKGQFIQYKGFEWRVYEKEDGNPSFHQSLSLEPYKTNK